MNNRKFEVKNYYQFVFGIFANFGFSYKNMRKSTKTKKNRKMIILMSEYHVEL